MSHALLVRGHIKLGEFTSLPSTAVWSGYHTQPAAALPHKLSSKVTLDNTLFKLAAEPG